MSPRVRRYAQRSLAGELAALLREHLVPKLRERAQQEPILEAEIERDCPWADVQAWREARLYEIAGAWVLGGLFVRILEDRGLVGSPDNPRGLELLRAEEGGTAGMVHAYLLEMFSELDARLGSRPGFAEHGAWLSLRDAREIAEVMYLVDDRGDLCWQFGRRELDFLVDVYQHVLGDLLRECYGLVATPRFVAQFIAEHAIEQGLGVVGRNAVSVLDPACGSGELLLAAFRYLLVRVDNTGNIRMQALEVLARIHGVDIEPVAVLMARFRLLMEFVEATGTARLAEVPRLPMRLAAGDSLLAGRVEGRAVDAPAAALLRQRYAVVISNPPYMTCREPRLRELHRQYYRSARGKCSLVAPFVELFLELATSGGVVGTLVGNSFSKREFGKPLIEEVLARIDIDSVIDLSGAYIPGHGTPTLILFLRNQPPSDEPVQVVFGRSGEPIAPRIAEQGKVWTAIREHWEQIGYADEHIAVRRLPRESVNSHPWMLQDPEEDPLRSLTNDRSCPLGELAETMPAAITGLDEIFALPAHVARRHGIEPAVLRPVLRGEGIGDWAIAAEIQDEAAVVIIPYDADGTLLPVDGSRWGRYLWPYKALLRERMSLGRSVGEREWWRWLRWERKASLATGRVAGPLVAAYPRYVWLEGEPIHFRTVLAFQIDSQSMEERRFAVLAYLDSSAASFWLCSRAHSTSARGWPLLQSEDDATPDIFDAEPREADTHKPRTNTYYEFSAAVLNALPIPRIVLASGQETASLAELARELQRLAHEARQSTPSAVLAAWDGSSKMALLQSLATTEQRRRRLWRQMICHQEDIDWLVYSMLGLVNQPLQRVVGRALPEERPFAWLNDVAPGSLSKALREPWTQRRRLLRHTPELRALERLPYKRPWSRLPGTGDRPGSDSRHELRDACRSWLLARIESMLPGDVVISVRELAARIVQQSDMQSVLELYSGVSFDMEVVLHELVTAEAVPYLAAHRYSRTGMAKRAVWEACWAHERRRDAGQSVQAERATPLRYTPRDFASPVYWRLRGKLDVPRERFVSYPEVETASDPTMVLGPATVDLPARLRALTALYDSRKGQPGWDAERLAPILAGMLELLPWLEQWYSSAKPPEDAETLRRFVAAEATALGISMSELYERAALSSNTDPAAI